MEVEQLKLTTGLTHAKLPMRYLGVPLCTKKLSLANCEPLIQQVQRKVTSWSARSLSFAGRLLLINTVIAGISNFWCSTFILPATCLKKINSMCGAYLWKGTIEGHHSAKVSWSTVTLSKEEGGLGIRNLKYWNKACLLKLIWLLFFRSGSIWVAWFRKEHLADDLNNFWTLKEKQNQSWLLHKLLRVRSIAFHWIKLRLNNGRQCRFWTDNWSPFPNLQTLLNPNGNSRLGIALNSTVASLYTNGAWALPRARTDNQVSFLAYLSTIILTEENDCYEWCPDGVLTNKYATGAIYNILKEHLPLVPWSKLVWNSRAIPKQSCLAWLFILNRCPTRDRISGWGLPTQLSCLLCNGGTESRNHLYFECSFSGSLWRRLTAKARVPFSHSWDVTVANLLSRQVHRHVNLLGLLAWQTAIYHLWSERNNRLHRNQFRSTDSLLRSIDGQIRNKLSSFRSSSPVLASQLFQLWFDSPPI